MITEEVRKKLYIIKGPFSKDFFLEFIGTGEELAECITEEILRKENLMYSLNKRNISPPKNDDTFKKEFFESIHKRIYKLKINSYNDLVLNKKVLIDIIKYFYEEKEYSKIFNFLKPNIRKLIYWGERTIIQELLDELNKVRTELTNYENETVRFYRLYVKIIPYIEDENLSNLEDEFKYFFKLIKSTKLKTELYNLYGIFHMRLAKPDFQKALLSYNKGLEICKDNCSKLKLLENKANILKLENPSEALKIFKEAKNLISEIKNIEEYELAKFYYNYSSILYETNDSEFEEVFAKARALSNDKYPDIELLTFNLTSDLFIKKNDFEAYFISASICLFLSSHLYYIFFENEIFKLIRNIIKYTPNNRNYVINGLGNIQEILKNIKFVDEYNFFKALEIYLQEGNICNEKYIKFRNKIKIESLKSILDDVIEKISINKIYKK